ncbi:MAG: acyl-CoA dehydrogenase family protein [Acidimicrobiia bacterium]|nr:acyl-CoA dehydrogenase family protein [Acidimicrobiia bacterium]NNC43095.1 acyl-CoA dehydrogenase [Acidimicrobiia bacterium]NND12961.1 acyl-CoA dehydrogenase [Acidimicrobiia bacterium]NNL28374.1 acyl-CoA dehydrogenase [Acidimicrobiia bacterium]
MTQLPIYSEEHDLFRSTLRDFVATELTPYVNEWDEAGEFPIEVYKKAGEIGLFGIGFAEEYGGLGTHDPLLFCILAEELARSSGGVSAGLFSNYIGGPPIQNAGSDDVKAEILPSMLSGDVICALGITEPSGGSDVANLQTTARLDGDHYVVNGSKTFITSGMRADYVTTAVRTGGAGAAGVSMLVIPSNLDGFSKTPLKKMGWWASDTATLYFDDCRVPARYLLGAENSGFKIIMENFNYERLFLIAGMIGASRVCFEEALAWAQERETFGSRLADHQVIRHKLVEMDRMINASYAWMEKLAWQVSQNDHVVAQLAECKVQSSLTMEFCAREAAQILGGASYLRDNPVERIYREVRVNAIGGGSEEIMRDLAARQLGI